MTCLGVGVGVGVEETTRIRARCAYTKFKELSPILTAHGASDHINKRTECEPSQFGSNRDQSSRN